MRSLLESRFAPITFTVGFVESPFARFAEAFLGWQDGLEARFRTRSEQRSFRAPLERSLFALDPLNTPLDRYLLTETRSGWSAIFANGLRLNDVHSPVAYLPTILGCRGLETLCVPDRSQTTEKDALQIYGAVTFSLYGAENTDWLNRIRTIRLANDVGGWEFSAQGEVQAFERVEKYQKRKIADRFTAEMLGDYCAALGIDLFDADFYGEQSVLYHTTHRKNPGGPRMSIEEARGRVYL